MQIKTIFYKGKRRNLVGTKLKMKFNIKNYLISELYF